MFYKDKSLYNRLNVANKKADYNSCATSSKRCYLRQEDEMLQNLKRTNPRSFHKLFRKTNKNATRSNLTTQNFFRYFSKFVSPDEQDGFDRRNEQETNIIFDELDINFSAEEIREQIWTASSEFGTYRLCELLAHTSSESRGTFRQKARSLAPLNGLACAVKICHDGMLEDTNSLDGLICKLKTHKSPGIDCLLNEMFIKCKDIFIPIFKLFDHPHTIYWNVSRRMVKRHRYPCV